ncbi:hypothetical protein L1987_70637 [Smallanthus sonchifolius]|uniref:Uncharacterized protein n=1 Tax=Smallanthus sonchifolius TaxID=185202 RepID=A0ACB9AQV2_9ASTR|nr:hypothetical protein L1987_70637 [Smallanthus sonchifolius]
MTSSREYHDILQEDGGWHLKFHGFLASKERDYDESSNKKEEKEMCHKAIGVKNQEPLDKNTCEGTSGNVEIKEGTSDLDPIEVEDDEDKTKKAMKN